MSRSLGWAALAAVVAVVTGVAVQNMDIMNTLLNDTYKYALVGLLWGGTNPLLRKATATQEPGSGLWGALANWKFLALFGLNQCGSLLYAYLLGTADPTLAVPVSNTFTFVFTVLAAAGLGETGGVGPYTVAGVLLVGLGAGVCVASKAA